MPEAEFMIKGRMEQKDSASVRPCHSAAHEVLACSVVALSAAAEHEPRCFHTKAEGEKNRADPDIFRREQHQHQAQDDQQDRQESPGARISDHIVQETGVDIINIDLAVK